MAKDNEKKRLNRAIRRAADILVSSNYSITFLPGAVFNLEALREREIRKIRVVLDVINQDDERKVRILRVPSICTKEIWCKRYKEPLFSIKEIG